MDCCRIFAKIVIVTISLIFLLASALMLAFGIAAKVNPSSIATVFDRLIPEDTRSSLQNVAGVSVTDIVVSNAVFMIVIGVIGIVLASIGFIGACCKVRWLLVTYASLLILLLLGEIALIIFAAVYTDTFKSVAQDSMNKTLQEFRNDVYVNSNGTLILPSKTIDLAWTTVQLREKCCGAYNWTDYLTIPWNKNATGTSLIVPISCCKQVDNAPYPTTAASFVSLPDCRAGLPSAISQKNCYDAVKADVDKFIEQYKTIAIGIAAGIIGLELILIILAFILCATHDRSNKYA